MVRGDAGEVRAVGFPSACRALLVGANPTSSVGRIARLLPGLVALGLPLSGCFVDRGGLEPADAAPVDGGDLDAERGDAGPPPEGGWTDGGCTAADDRCELEVAVTCALTGLSRADCADSSAYCELGECIPWLCTPGSLNCGADLYRCVSRGSGFAVEETCPRGCSMNACRPPRDCGYPIDHTMGEGTYFVDLCGTGDEQIPDLTMSDDCDWSFPGEDVIVRVEIRLGGMFRLELDDADDMRLVDPVLYLRTTCDDPLSQVECDDDSGDSLDDALITRRLDAGDHFFVLDSLNYNPSGMSNTRTCGRVRFRVTRLS